MAFDPTNLNFQKQLSDVIGFDNYGVDQLRTVEWGRKYLWAVRFLSSGKGARDIPPPPFNDFFPASDVEFPLFSLDSYALDMGQSSYKIPQRSQVRQLSITFFDDVNSTLLKWFRDWVEIDILNKGKFVSCLRDDHNLDTIENGLKDSFGNGGVVRPVRVIQVEQLTPQLEPTGLAYNLHIYPEGEINFVGASASEAQTYTVNFVIVGETQQKQKEKEGSNVNKLKDLGVKTLGRFL
jgi:hypothetical protein